LLSKFLGFIYLSYLLSKWYYSRVLLFSESAS
jgi:hypothetical protein